MLNRCPCGRLTEFGTKCVTCSMEVEEVEQPLTLDDLYSLVESAEYPELERWIQDNWLK